MCVCVCVCVCVCWALDGALGEWYLLTLICILTTSVIYSDEDCDPDEIKAAMALVSHAQKGN